MNTPAVALSPEATQAFLSAALREVHGADVSLERWTAQPLAKRGRQRVVRFDLDARVAGIPDVQHHEWVGKFYERDDEARAVATVLRELAATDCAARGGLIIPRVLAYYAPRYLLLMTYESGESVVSAIAHGNGGGAVPAAIGRALAALHTTSLPLAGVTSPADVLDALRPRIAELCARYPDQSDTLRQVLTKLEQQMPPQPATQSLLHGDLGPAQLLWRTGTIVVLDFDKCTRGDPALDLGNLLTQVRRINLRKPGKLPALAAIRREILDAYQRAAPYDPGLAQRVHWYELTALLRKVHFLTFVTTRHTEAEALEARQAEAMRLLEQLPLLLAGGESRAVRPSDTPAAAARGTRDVKHRKRTRLRQFFWSHLQRIKGRLVLAGLFTLCLTATDLLQPWPLKIILDHGILDKPLPQSLRFLQGFADNGTITFLVAAASSIVLIAVLDGLFSYFQRYITASIGYQMVYALRRELFTHLQRLSLSFHTRAQSGDLLTRIGGDSNTLKDILGQDSLKFLSQLLTIVGMCVIMIAINWQMSLIALATLPLLCYSLFYLYRKTKASVKTQRRQEGRVASRMSEVLSAIPMVQAFAREAHEEERFDAVTAVTLRESIRIARLEAAATRSSQIITALGTAAAVLFGALLVRNGGMTPGDLVLMVAYLTTLYKPIRGLARLTTDFSKAMASADRLSEVLDIEPEIQDRPDAIEAARLRGEIAFQGVSFDYGDGKEVLRDVSFDVSPGQRVALVGVSGAGKSTIASLILRLYEPQEGVILIDGVNIQHYRRESLRRQIGIVLQQSILFGATVRENIAYGSPDAGLGEIEAAARAANAHEFIRELENGYDTVIGERGATLSGGQQQRIAIARALIRNAPILMLDEPMTGLDVESEAKVREALDRLMAGKTCFMITHDLQSIADADLVLVLEEGRIADRGTHAELLAGSGRYRQLYELDHQPPAAKPSRTVTEPKPARKQPARAVWPRTFPADPDFPQLTIASDPGKMLEVFRAHLKPVAGKRYHIQSCRPFRFRCRQSTARCVLQYTLRVVDPDTGRKWDQPVTGLVYARKGEAARLWLEMRAADPLGEIPERWQTFEPVEYIPDLQMLVEVFPYDRRLRNLRDVLDGVERNLEPLLLARLEPGQWHATAHTLEPTRYRTELGAVFRLTMRAREARTRKRTQVRCYLKVYRNDHGGETYQLLQSCVERAGSGPQPYSVIQPIAYLGELRTLVLEEAAGAPLQRFLLNGRTPAAMHSVARAVAALNQGDLGITERRSPLADQLDELKRAATIVQWACPEASAVVQTITAAVVAGLEEVAPAPIHGDLKPDHIFLSGDHVCFIDFDSVTMGDPVRDPAHLYAYLVGGVGSDSLPPKRAREAAAAFIDGYFAHVPAEWRKRFALHSAGALIEVACGIFRHQEPQWPDKVTAAVREAHSLAILG